MIINLSSRNIMTIITALYQQEERLTERTACCETDEAKVEYDKYMEEIDDVLNVFNAIEDAEKEKYFDMTEEEQEKYDNDPNSYPICWFGDEDIEYSLRMKD